MSSADNDRRLARDEKSESRDVNGVLLGLLEVSSVALGPSMPQAPVSDLLLALRSLLAIVDRCMPSELQAQDRRVVHARELEEELTLRLESA